jgi:hypothetical protein
VAAGRIVAPEHAALDALLARTAPGEQGARKGGAVVYRLLRDIADGFWSGVDYIRFCRWMP